MKRKIIVVVLLAAILAFGCRRNEDYSPLALSDNIMYESESMLFRGSSASDFEETSEFAYLNNIDRKLIKQAFIKIRVDNLSRADAYISDLINKYNGYTASTYAEDNIFNYSIRVPSHRYDAFLAEVNGAGRLISRSENTEDVTIRYSDLEGRLETKKELLKTFQSYLARARTIEEILAVEERIAILQFDIDRTGSQLRQLGNRVDYATIDLTLFGPPVLITHNQSETFGQQIKMLISNFGIFFFTIVLIILGLLVYGIPVVALFAFFVWLLFGRVGLLKKLWMFIMTPRRNMRNANE